MTKRHIENYNNVNMVKHYFQTLSLSIICNIIIIVVQPNSKNIGITGVEITSCDPLDKGDSKIEI